MNLIQMQIEYEPENKLLCRSLPLVIHAARFFFFNFSSHLLCRYRNTMKRFVQLWITGITLNRPGVQQILSESGDFWLLVLLEFTWQEYCFIVHCFSKMAELFGKENAKIATIQFLQLRKRKCVSSVLFCYHSFRCMS